MQVWVAVNEADIGKIHPGQPVTFTVDAFPGETFQGTVGKVRLNASMTQNVVTYTVEISTENKDKRLLPYLTANVQFELQRLDNVLRVPNAALRWKPQEDQIAPQYRKAGGQAVQADARTAGAGQPVTRGDRASAGKRRLLWTVDGAYVRPIPVSAGVSDGILTAVTGEGLTEGMPLVTGQAERGGGTSDARNPFTPQFRRSSRSQSSSH
jgi:HlyD family secretion protein